MVYKGQKQTYNVQEMPTSNFDLDTNYSTWSFRNFLSSLGQNVGEHPKLGHDRLVTYPAEFIINH